MVFYRVLELAVAHNPVRYHDLIATKQPRASAVSAAAGARTPAEPGASSCEPPVENRGSGLLRLDGYPQTGFMSSTIPDSRHCGRSGEGHKQTHI
jgi:hypothetical protein